MVTRAIGWAIGVVVAAALLGTAVLVFGGGDSSSTANRAAADPADSGPPLAGANANPLPSYTSAGRATGPVPAPTFAPVTPPPVYVPVASGAVPVLNAPARGTTPTLDLPGYDPGADNSLEARVRRNCTDPPSPPNPGYRMCYDTERNKETPAPVPGG
ncbi:MAG: hypothetical protein M3Z02_00450 [Actinomycetota bacterium]|nr:hypothetical protein [Actinomycetota bacterium]